MNSIAFYRATFFFFLHAPICRTGTKSVRQLSLPKIRSDHGQHRRVSTNRGVLFQAMMRGHRQRGVARKMGAPVHKHFVVWSNFEELNSDSKARETLEAVWRFRQVATRLRMLRGVTSGKCESKNAILLYSYWIFMDFCCNEFSLARPSWLATPALSCNFFVSLKSRER